MNQVQSAKSERQFILEEKIYPILTLLLLPAVIAELLFGSTYASIIIIILPEIGLYGCFAILVRYVVIKKNLHSTSIILLGLVFALLMQIFITQTSLAPLALSTGQAPYGRIAGVNWIYLIWALGFQSTFGIFIPIKLFDLIYPEKQNDVLVGMIGVIVLIIAFLISAFTLWYAWTQIAYPLFNNTTPYIPSNIPFLIAIIVMVLLVILALLVKRKNEKPIKINQPIPSNKLIAITMFVLSLSWFLLLLFAFGVFSSIPIEQPILFSLIIVVVTIVALVYWSKSTSWTDVTTILVIISVILASMIAGFFTSGISRLADIIIKLFLDIIAIGLLFLLYKVKSEDTKPEKKNKKKVIKIT